VGSALFCWGVLYVARQLPSSASAPRVGQRAPEFTLPDQDGNSVALADLIASHAATPGGGGGGALLIFYRGSW
jgi:peroxiredoxin